MGLIPLIPQPSRGRQDAPERERPAPPRRNQGQGFQGRSLGSRDSGSPRQW
ncbi:unnamed protein product [Lepidochelys kempii]